MYRILHMEKNKCSNYESIHYLKLFFMIYWIKNSKLQYSGAIQGANKTHKKFFAENI